MVVQRQGHTCFGASFAVISVCFLFVCRVSAESEVSGLNDTCIYYHELDYDQQCSFIEETDDCKSESGFINYLVFTYCAFSANIQPLALIILFIWLTFLFVCLGVTAKNFFCPTLTTISKALKLSDNVAGVTFLAFGNGAPDVFSAIAAITHSKDGDAGLAIGALFGAAVFITTFVAGTVSALRSFDVSQVPFLRDAIFVVGASYWTFYILYTGQIWTSEAVGFILLYLCYVCVVLLAGKFGKSDAPSIRVKNSSENVEGGLNSERADNITSNVDSPKENQDIGEAHTIENVYEKPTENDATGKPCSVENVHEVHNDSSESYTSSKANLKEDVHDTDKETQSNVQPTPIEFAPEKPKDFAGGNPENESVRPKLSGFGTINPITRQGENPPSDTHNLADIAEIPEEFTGGNPEEEPLLPKKQKPGGFYYQLRVLFKAVNPIDVEGWKSKSYFMRFFEIYRFPIKLLLHITVPLVLHDECSWNKLLNCFQLLIGPVWCVFIINGYDMSIAGEFYLWELMLCFGVVLAVLAFFTSELHTPPVYYIVFAFLGFVISVCWIFAIANEIVNLLRMYGMVFDLSDAILGLTFLAWGNCIGDLVADTAMARQGAPKMAISACFGGPIFNMLIGIGVACTIATIQNGGTFKLKTDTLQFVLAAGLGASLFFSMFFMIAAKFRATKFYATLLYIFYAVFLTVAILTETEVLKW